MQLARLTWSSSMHYRIWRIFGYTWFTYWSTHKTRHSWFIQYIYKIYILIHFKNICSSNNYVHLFKDTYFKIHWIIEMNSVESPLNIYQRLTIDSFFSHSSYCRLIARFGKRVRVAVDPPSQKCSHYVISFTIDEFYNLL